MTPKGMMIFRDITYTILIVIVLFPTNPLGLTPLSKILVTIVAVGVRIWQHVNHYKKTGKIY
jgi:hypothetical protein